jgi:hypothetical protein
MAQQQTSLAVRMMAAVLAMGSGGGEPAEPPEPSAGFINPETGNFFIDPESGATLKDPQT